ncbi:MAG: CDP-alcohol phosphatidyltransferase family protein [Hyphomicrobiales bacterium]|nr:CDP-alcohol phosphatidyltransferase family protein [Hyphomicrobiales bacterium]
MDLAKFGSLPNIITICRLLLVPVIVSMIVDGEWDSAFAVFVIAGASDAADGWLAKTFDLRSELGAFLDPLADKTLLVSIYVALGIAHVVPATLAILVVSRDVMIVGGVITSWLLDNPIAIRPIFLSKINTTAQIGFAAAVLGALAFGIPTGLWFAVGLWLVAALTVASAGAYLVPWISHMGH